MDNNTRQLTISTGDRVNSAKWTVKQVSFESLCEKLSTTIVTEETVEEYHSLISTNKTKYKDYGGFVGGKLKESARSKESVEFRSMLTLDAEHVEESFLDKVKAYNEYKLFLYTTHGHTPTNPRARIIFPLLRDVSGDEYNAIARLVAEKLGINNFDTVSYRANQLMFWPSTPKDGEFISFGNATETWLDPDSFLASYPDWKNIATLPKSDKETPYRGQEKHATDPLKKQGIVGAFCRTYTIQEAIEEFLSDVYEPSCIEGRYDYKPADSFAGV